VFVAACAVCYLLEGDGFSSDVCILTL